MTDPIVTTSLSLVDGHAGLLALRGVRIEDAVELGYPAAVALLLGGNAAGPDVAAALVARPIPPVAAGLAGALPPLPPMARLRALVAALEEADDDEDRNDAGHNDEHRGDVERAGVFGRLVARLGASPRRDGDADVDYVATILRGTQAAGAPGPAEDDAAVLGACFVVHLDHALNPSTLAVRTAASVGASLSACFSAGLGTLEGPLHGGASSAVGELLDGIAAPDDVDAVLDDRAARRRRVPGFGHPIYRQRDPRAAVLRDLCARAARRHGHRVLDIAVRVEERVVERSAGRLFPNVDFYAAALYATLGIPLALHTPLFFAARALGWVAHRREQRQQRRVISPEAGYDGPPIPRGAVASTEPGEGMGHDAREHDGGGPLR